jgi:hypothetical protein
MTIPLGQRLAEEAGPALQRVATGSPYFWRLVELAQARPLMQQLVDGSRLFLEAEEWINKSSGHGSLCVKAQAEDGSEETLVEWPFVMFPGWDYVDVFPHLFPWTSISIDKDYYESYDEAQWDVECGIWNSEDGCYIMHTKSLSEVALQIRRHQAI